MYASASLRAALVAALLAVFIPVSGFGQQLPRLPSFPRPPRPQPRPPQPQAAQQPAAQPLNAKLDELWGAVRESPADKQREIERYKAIYKAGYSSPGDAGCAARTARKRNGFYSISARRPC